MATTQTQLKADLSLIGAAIKNADGVPDSIKQLFGEIVAWNDAIVEHTKDLDNRLEAAEAAIDEIIDGDGEMLSPDTVAQLVAGFEHTQLLCQATAALLEGPLAAALDEVSKKRFGQLIENTMKTNALSMQIVSELATTDDEALEDDDGDGDGDGLGDGDGTDADADAEEEGEATDE